MTDDKRREALRYNSASERVLSCHAWGDLPVGKKSVPDYLKEPYEKFESEVLRHITSFRGRPRVLELCAGTGNFSAIPIKGGAVVTASDIAESALNVLEARYHTCGDLTVAVADIEGTGFACNTFDLVMCAGGLSYGDNQLVLDEVFRLLKPGGFFICVDSLNHNPIYRLNRYFHFVRGNRTASTLLRMPSVGLIDAYRARFGTLDVWYFGCISWATPLVSRFVGDASAYRLSKWVDRFINVKSSAFKFVMTAKKSK